MSMTRKYSVIPGPAGIHFYIKALFTKAAAALVLVAALSLTGAGTVFADPVAPYWDTQVEQRLPVSSDLLTTFGVRDGGAGADFLGISNTNFDFTAGAITSPDQYPAPSGATLSTVAGAGLAIWATSVNENTNPYYQNLYYNAVTPGASATQATTWMSSPQASWGDSNGSASTNYYTGNPTIAGLEYSPDIIFGANKYTGWQNAAFDGSNSNTIINEYFSAVPGDDYGPAWVNNDATNIWTQIYTLNQLAQTAKDLMVGTTKTTRYDNGDPTVSAINYEKAIRGNLLYLASLLDSDELERKTVAYLYSIDSNGVGYFFVPQAADLLLGDDTGIPPTTSTNPDTNYAANNATMSYGYMATLPFITNTFDSCDVFDGGIIMGVEDIFKANPACVISGSAPTALEDVDYIFYNTTMLRGTNLIGEQDGKNSSGIDINSYYSPSYVSAWSEAHGFTGSLIAGDDYFTSVYQSYGTVDTTSAGMSPLLYSQRSYTMDKNARAAWAFAQVYPDEAYDNNPDATYAYWVDKIYHINLDDVPTVAAYMTNKSSEVIYNQNTVDFLEANFEFGQKWWDKISHCYSYWPDFAYYNGSTRASYYSGDAGSEEDQNTIGVFAPLGQWSGSGSSGSSGSCNGGGGGQGGGQSSRVQPSAVANGVSITRIQQEQTKWCWAASAQMVGKYLNPNSTVTQEYIVFKKYKALVNEGGEPDDVVDGIETVASNGIQATASNAPLTAAQSIAKINEGKPFVAGFMWANPVTKVPVGYGHMYVVFGYSYAYSSNPTLAFINPAEGMTMPEYYSYSELSQHLQTSSGYGRYTVSVYPN